MLIDLPIAWIITLNVFGWPIVQFALAWSFTCMPASWFHPGTARSWEEGGRVYERSLAIRKWKDRLPDAARWFSGGFAKANLRGREPDYLQRFIRETWRGELCHWAALAFTPVFFLWNPLWADGVMVGYAVVANLPCILVQRYNRARFQRLLARPVPASTARSSSR